jgi:hypothetical protein
MKDIRKWYPIIGSNFDAYFLNLEDGTDRLSQNVGKLLPLNAEQYPRSAQIPSTSRRKPKVKKPFLRLL